MTLYHSITRHWRSWIYLKTTFIHFEKCQMTSLQLTHISYSHIVYIKIIFRYSYLSGCAVSKCVSMLFLGISFLLDHKKANHKFPREPQHTPGTYPRPSTTCWWRKSCHICILGYLGSAPRVCWKILRKLGQKSPTSPRRKSLPFKDFWWCSPYHLSVEIFTLDRTKRQPDRWNKPIKFSAFNIFMCMDFEYIVCVYYILYIYMYLL